MATSEGLDIIGQKTYKPVGVCIYCGDTTPLLTDEHIIPYALNGDWILPESSCKRCAKITGQLEQRVLRGELWHLRTALNFQTRRRSEQPKVVRFKADGVELDVPINDCPILMHFIKFPPPGMLEGRVLKPGIDALGHVTIRWGPDPGEFAKRHGIKNLSMTTDLRPAEFARMIAKIAYSHVVARFGLKAIADDFVSSVILGNSTRIGHVIGCASGGDPLTTTQPNTPVLRPEIYKGGLSGEDRLLAVKVKLFADSPTPVYQVVIGRPAPWLEDLSRDYYSE